VQEGVTLPISNNRETSRHFGIAEPPLRLLTGWNLPPKLPLNKATINKEAS
jgi:hypothetical protein